MRARPHNLPIQPTSFVGRLREIDEALRLMAEARLLTLTGTGGCGKTRLALEVAARARSRHRDGVWFVELAALTDGSLLPGLVASVLEVPEQPDRALADVLADALATRDLLLVLDNCEHLVESCAKLVDQLLRVCPALHVLATSRERLNLAGETAWRVPSLSLPAIVPDLPPGRLLKSEAVDLFLRRAMSVKADFRLSDEDAPVVAEICRRLDGLPLAIELAAARTPVLSPRQIAERLDDRFRLLTSGTRNAPTRQQTLRATLDWSYGLLSTKEQWLFDRLSVFNGGWTLAAAEAVCSMSLGGSSDIPTPGNRPEDGSVATERAVRREDVLDLLGALVAKSLIHARADESQTVHFGMLETLRQYGQDHLLGDRQQAARTGEKHASYFLSLVEETPYWELITGPNQHQRLAALEREHDNVRAAMRWLIARGEIEKAYRLAGALGRFWLFRGHLTEGRAWLAELLARTDASVTDSVRAMALYTAGNLAMTQGDFAAAAPVAQASLQLWRALGRPREEAWSLHVVGTVALRGGDATQARKWFEEALATSVTAPNPDVEGLSYHNLGDLALDEGEAAQSLALATKALEVGNRIESRAVRSLALSLLGEISYDQGDDGAAAALLEAGIAEARSVIVWLLSWALARLASVVARQGDLDRAWVVAAESLDVSRRLGDRLGIARALEAFALLAGWQDRPERALRLAAAAIKLRQSIAAPPSRREERALERTRAAAKLSAGPDIAEASETQGRAMSLEQAIAYACDVDVSQPSKRSAASLDNLTPRERDVLRLLARGRSNRQIAAELVLGERTVETHVSNILSKLGLNSRAEAAIWAVENNIRTASP
jgi:non-specific serine/threonine protein kinase